MPKVAPVVYNEPEQVVPAECRGKKYVIIQADGEISARYRSAAAACAKFNADGKPAGLRNVGEMEIILLSMTLKYAGPEWKDLDGTMVPESEVRKLPEPFLKQCFDAAKILGHLQEMDTSLEGLKKQRDLLNKQIKEMEEAAAERKNDEMSFGGGSA